MICLVAAFGAMFGARVLGYDSTIQGALFLIGMVPGAWFYFTATSDSIAAERKPPRR